MQGLQLTLFDVADATAPRVLRSLTLGEAGSASALEQSRHGLAMRLDAAPGGAVATPTQAVTAAGPAIIETECPHCGALLELNLDEGHA